jgi:hypothetical protein
MAVFGSQVFSVSMSSHHATVAAAWVWASAALNASLAAFHP